MSVGGSRRSRTREAQSALAEAIDAHRRQEFVAPTVLRLNDFFETWIDTLETQGRKVSTIEGYRKTMRRYVLPTLGSYRLQDLRPTDLDDLYAALLKSGGVNGRPLSMTIAPPAGYVNHDEISA